MRFLSPAWLVALIAVPPLLFLTSRIVRKAESLSAARRRAFLILRAA